MTLVSVDDVETPIGLVDLDRARENAEKAVAYLGEHGMTWRPHVKTHKSLDIAKIQLDAGAAGLTVATPHEAEVMSTLCNDLLLAYPPLGDSKLSRLAQLNPDVRLTVGLDSRAALEPLAAKGAQHGRTFGVLIEFDAGLKRVGVPTPEEALELARLARDLDGVEPRGLMFYPGHIRIPGGQQDGLLSELDERLASFIDALAAAGLAPDVVSGGSTPTLWNSHRLRGVTEVRAGTAIFNDRDIHNLEACDAQQLAYSVLTTVVSTAVPGQAVVDAGSKALAKESFRSGTGGFGAVFDRPDVLVRALSEEHGVLDLSQTSWRPEVGDRVRIVPNHVCVSVNLQDGLVALEDGGARWLPLDGRGRGPYSPAP